MGDVYPAYYYGKPKRQRRWGKVWLWLVMGMALGILAWLVVSR